VRVDRPDTGNPTLMDIQRQPLLSTIAVALNRIVDYTGIPGLTWRIVRSPDNGEAKEEKGPAQKRIYGPVTRRVSREAPETDGANEAEDHS
jgi:hypothetical protein